MAIANILNGHGRTVPPEGHTVGSTLATVAAVAEGRHRGTVTASARADHDGGEDGIMSPRHALVSERAATLVSRICGAKTQMIGAQ
jgi:hypothetical protein